MRGHLLRAYKITTEHSPWCFCRIWGNQGMKQRTPLFPYFILCSRVKPDTPAGLSYLSMGVHENAVLLSLMYLVTALSSELQTKLNRTHNTK